MKEFENSIDLVSGYPPASRRPDRRAECPPDGKVAARPQIGGASLSLVQEWHGACNFDISIG